jgi:hypothetical protein
VKHRDEALDGFDRQALLNRAGEIASFVEEACKAGDAAHEPTFRPYSIAISELYIISVQSIGYT